MFGKLQQPAGGANVDAAKAPAKAKKAKGKTKAKAKAGWLEPKMSSMQEDIKSLFDTIQVYRDWLKSIQDRVFKLEGAMLKGRT